MTIRQQGAQAPQIPGRAIKVIQFAALQYVGFYIDFSRLGVTLGIVWHRRPDLEVVANV